MVKVILITSISTLILCLKFISFSKVDYEPFFSTTNFNHFPDTPATKNHSSPSPSELILPSEPISLSSIEFQIQPSGQCHPASFGYTPEEHYRNFPKKKFKPCRAEPGIIEIKNDSLSMSCPGTYYLGTKPKDESISMRQFTQKRKQYSTQVNISDVEWAFGSCSPKHDIQGAAVLFKEKKEVEERVKAKMQELENKFQVNKTRPITIINVFLDSVSRQSFFRRLPKTVEFINNLNRSLFKVYDFKLHSVLADNTLPNLYPLWTGKNFMPQSQEKQDWNKKQDKDLIYDLSLWKFLRERGWVTLFQVEFCKDYFTIGIGKKPQVDHLFGQFWCGAKDLLKYSEVSTKPRCVGNKYAHQVSFDYLKQYINSYPGLNKWAHLGSLSAHESSGSLIDIYDDDTIDLLHNITSLPNDFILFLAADHGHRYGEWYKSENGSQEHHLPTLVLIASSSLIESIKFSDDALRHNSNNLITKKDIHESIKFLSQVPYGQTSSPSEFAQNDRVNLFKHKVSTNRDCPFLKIPVEYCPCNHFQELDSKFRGLIERVADLTAQEINRAVLTNDLETQDLCQFVQVEEVLNGEIVKERKKALIKVWFRLKGIKEVFEGFGMIFSGKMRLLGDKESFGFRPFYQDGKRIFRVLGLKSNYTGKCGVKAWEFGIMPNLCICKDS